jgi:uncharacterized protein YkwD
LYQTAGGITEFELRVVELINAERAKLNLSLVQIDETLMQAARYYSQIMFELGILSHNTGPYVTSPSAEHGASGNVAKAFGANVSWGGGNGALGQRTPESLIEGWLNSPGHKAYIVSPEHRFIGVGRTGLYTYMFLSDEASGD